MLVVAVGQRDGRLHGSGHHEAGVLAHAAQVRDERLRRRRRSPRASPRGSSASRSSARASTPSSPCSRIVRAGVGPRELGVALVARHEHVVRSAPRARRARGRRGDPWDSTASSPRARARARRRRGRSTSRSSRPFDHGHRHRAQSGQRRAHRVGRVADRRDRARCRARACAGADIPRATPRTPWCPRTRRGRRSRDRQPNRRFIHAAAASRKSGVPPRRVAARADAARQLVDHELRRRVDRACRSSSRWRRRQRRAASFLAGRRGARRGRPAARSSRRHPPLAKARRADRVEHDVNRPRFVGDRRVERRRLRGERRRAGRRDRAAAAA